MPAFTITGSVAPDGSWSINASVPNGQTVMGADVADLLLKGASHFMAHRTERVPTLAECEAMAAACALPDGWAATSDGVNVYQTLGEGGGTAYTRWYERGAQRVEAPCAADGSALPATREALLAQPPPEE